MRRKDREVKDYNQMLEILKSCDCCRIGFKEKQGTYIVPLNFGYEVNEQGLILYFHGAGQGKKIELVREQHIVGFELDTGHELIAAQAPCSYTFLYQSIIGKGNISLVENIKEKEKGLKAIMRHYSNNEEWQFNEQMLHAVSIIRLTVTEWSCKENESALTE